MVSRGIARQLHGTVIAVLAGWLTALLLLEATTAIELLQEPHYIVPDALVVGPIVSAWFMAYFILPVWGADPYPTVPVHSIIIYVVALADLHTLRCSCRISYSLPCIWGYSQSRSRFKRRLGLLHSSDHCRWCYMSDRFVDKTHVQASHLTNR